MSLRVKILAVLLSVFGLFAAAEYAIQRCVIYPAFLAVERNEAAQDVERCRGAFDREYRHLDDLCHDWSAWDDCYQFITDRNEGFVRSTLLFESFKSAKLNWVCLFDTRGNKIWSRVYDLKTGQSLPDEPLANLPAFRSHIQAVQVNVEGAKSGLLMTQYGPLLVAYRAIVTSRRVGPVRGTLVMGRFLDDDLVQSLREQTCLDFTLRPLGAQNLSAEEQAAAGRITHQSPVYFQAVDNRVLNAYAAISDIQDHPALLAQVAIPRAIVATGQSAIRYGDFSLICAALGASLAILFFMQRIATRPLERLTNLVIEIGRSSDLSLRLPLDVQGRDEIGALAREFNAMCQQLSHARQRLLEQSYYTGLAETSSGVLHNVRNALNPILVNIDSLRQELQAVLPDRAEADRPVGGPSSASDPDPVYSLVRSMKAKFDHLADRVSQVEDIMADHDHRSGPGRMMEALPLDTLIRESTDLVPDTLLETLLVELSFDPEHVPAVCGNRISLLQVFANLFINAAEAIQEAGLESGRVEVEACPERDNDRDVVHICFRDNGGGISPETLQRIFERGFTTKDRGGKASGLGLHWCANTVTILGGRMYAESPGPGQGACLHLVLPANEATAAPVTAAC